MKRVRQVTFVSLFFLVFLSGCGSHGHWVKDDMSSYRQDVVECRTKSQGFYDDKGRTRPIFDQGRFNQCMRDGGYKWVED
jgi:hypothetical protein